MLTGELVLTSKVPNQGVVTLEEQSANIGVVTKVMLLEVFIVTVVVSFETVVSVRVTIVVTRALGARMSEAETRTAAIVIAAAT
jgi:hypothetical protein